MRVLILMALLVIVPHHAMADTESDIKYRQAVFKAIGGHMSAIATILRGHRPMDNFKLHADGIADLAAVVPELFPAGSGDGKTEALPVIWTDTTGFDDAVKRLVDGADGMAAAAATGDMARIGPAMRTLGGACKNCHDNYREED